MIDRVGEVWETRGGDVWLVLRSTWPLEAGTTKHEILILDSRVASLRGQVTWDHERVNNLYSVRLRRRL